MPGIHDYLFRALSIPLVVLAKDRKNRSSLFMCRGRILWACSYAFHYGYSIDQLQYFQVSVI